MKRQASNEAALLAELHRLKMDLPSSVIESLLVYLAELDHWNRKMNLTGLSGAMRIRRLVTEPLWIGQQLSVRGRCMDIGSGNGSPAIPMALGLPIDATTLVEPRLRRVAFLRHVVGLLKIPNVTVERARIEDPGVLKPVEWITLQGVALAAALIEVLNRVCSVGTKVLWITAGGERPHPEASMIQVPDSVTEGWTFTVGGQAEL